MAGDICRLEESLCTHDQFGLKQNCPCDKNKACTGTVNGRALFCNGRTNLCKTCAPGEYGCPCNGGSCQGEEEHCVGQLLFFIDLMFSCFNRRLDVQQRRVRRHAELLYDGRWRLLSMRQ